MSSNTQIANMALSHLGIGQEIANLESERSEEANAIRAFYDTVRDFVQSDFPWPFLTKSQALALVAEDPTTEWDFSYRYPSDCLKIRRIFSSLRNDSRQSRIPFLFYHDEIGKLIYTDYEDAVIEYSAKLTTEDMWPADFVLAFSFLLAVYVAPRLTKGDPFKMREGALKLYQQQLSMAEQRSLNEEQAEQLPESEFVRAREADLFPVVGSAQSAVDFTS